MNELQLYQEVKRDEGLLLKPYKDSVGKWTIGVGTNLSDGITEEEAMYLYQNRMDKVEKEIRAKLPWFGKLSDARQRVLCNMGYNMGVAGLLQFKNTLAHIEAGRYKQAADAMLNSKWAGQVGQRAVRLAKMMEEG